MWGDMARLAQAESPGVAEVPVAESQVEQVEVSVAPSQVVRA